MVNARTSQENMLSLLFLKGKNFFLSSYKLKALNFTSINLMSDIYLEPLAMTRE